VIMMISGGGGGGGWMGVKYTTYFSTRDF